MKGNKMFLFIMFVYLIANIFFAAIAWFTKTWEPLVIAAVSGLGFVYFAFEFGMLEARGIVVNEDLIPVEIYQMIAVTMDGSFPVAILRNNKKERIACKSLNMEGFAHFSVIGEGNERFFVPKSLKHSTSSSYPIAGEELANTTLG